MKLFVVADPHGYLTEMKNALAEKGFFENQAGKLLICGDVLDRGQEACEMVDFLVELLAQDRLILIKGNHEDLFEQCLQAVAGGGIYELRGGHSHHRHNGTWDTLLQLGKMEPRLAHRYPEILCARVMQSPFYTTLLPRFLNYYEPEGSPYIFVHGWIPAVMSGYKPYAVYDYIPDWRQADAFLWERARWLNGMEMAVRYGVVEPEKTIVCGHFHTSWGHNRIDNRGSEWGADADFSPFSAPGIIALDGCTAHSGIVNCMVFDV